MKIYIPLFIFLLIGSIGCNLAEINENPNVPAEVPMQTLLPPAQLEMANALGGRTFLYSNIFSQHLEGTNNQELLTEQYNPDELFVGFLWDDYYANFMINLKIIIDKANTTQSPHYEGVAKVLMANALGLLTDIWGNVPFSNALQGANNLQPSYDEQADLYQTIQTLLDEAIVALNQTESVFSPSDDDLIYNGDLQKWKAAAWSLKARYFLHLSKKDNNAYTNALNALVNGFNHPNDDLTYPYLGTSNDANPIFQYFEITPNAIVDPQFRNLLTSLSDPREPYYIGIIPFTGGLTKVGTALASNDSPIDFISYIELKFIEAEAALLTGDNTKAQNALDEAVSMSITSISDGNVDQTTIDNYLQNNTQLTGNASNDLSTIITQKYIALFTQLEPWNDYRRTGFPNLQPNANGTNPINPNGEIPRRLIYPQSERLRNPNTPSPIPSMQERFWWDL